MWYELHRFVLHDARLTYYEKPGGVEKGCVDMANCFSVNQYDDAPGAGAPSHAIALMLSDPHLGGDAPV